MKKRALTAGALAGALFLAVAPGAATAAQTATGEKPSWSQFKKDTFKDADGQYIVNGDIPVSGTDALKNFYDSMPASINKGDLTANADMYGNPKLWSKTQVANLTYCVSDTFGSRKASVVSATSGGAALWQNASSAIKFIYNPAQDSNCNTSNNNVLFSVEPSNTTSYIARAFFPGDPKSARNVLVTPSLTTTSWKPSNIMGHELGHVLGFRHEQTRPEAGTCYEDNNWVPLTQYDNVSIMHYPQCNGGSQDLTFSSLDRQGTQKAYGV